MNAKQALRNAYREKRKELSQHEMHARLAAMLEHFREIPMKSGSMVLSFQPILQNHEVPIQYKAASDAYIQKSVLYKNGLTNIVVVQTALFSVNKAETDMSVAFIQVWQALLLKAAASGDFNLFLGQVR